MPVGRHPWFSYMGFDATDAPAGDVAQGQDGKGGGAPAAQPAQVPAALTNEQINSIIATRVEEARKLKERELSEAYGMPLDKVKEVLEAQKAADEAQKSEAQKAREAADREKAAAQQAQAQAATAIRKANVTLAVANAGARADRVAAATTLLLAELPAEADEAAIKTAAETFKTSYPEFFGASDSGKPPAYNPGGAPRNNNSAGGQSGLDAGRERARADFEKQAKEYRSPFDGYQLVGGPPGGNG